MNTIVSYLQKWTAIKILQSSTCIVKPQLELHVLWYLS